jgi:hypothetical protein
MTMKRAATALMIAATIFISSCGSSSHGDGGTGNTPAPPMSSWDSMLWDSGTWL